MATRRLDRKAYSAIRTMVLSGELGAGQSVAERKLAQKLGMSRTPVRAAIAELEREGLIRNVSPRSRAVSEISLQDVVEIYDLREMLHGMAARLLARRVTESQIKELMKLAEKVDVLISFGPDESEFHRYITSKCGNARLAQFAASVEVQLSRLRFHEMQARKTMSMDNPKFHEPTHKEIVEAIANGDSDRAEELARAHTREAKDSLLRYILGG